MKSKICFVALAAYHLLSGKDTGVTGGSELQEVMLARELVKEGYDISFVVADHGQKPFETIDGIKIFKAHRTDVSVGMPLKALFLWKAFDRANADIYFLKAGLAGVVSFYCLVKKKKFVYSIADDRNITGVPIIQDFCHRYIFNRLNRFDIKYADIIIVQSKYQQKLLKENFGKEGALIKSMHVSPNYKPKKPTLPIVLWVSTLREKKRPELFLKLARKIPNAKFQMIGGAALENPKIYENIKRSATELTNLDFMGFVQYRKIHQYFDQAAILVNTSISEGFPNTFLEAWARYVPVVSLNIDPDEIICRYKLGVHSKTFEQMVEDIKLLLRDGKLREKLGMNGGKYVEEEHNIKNILRKYSELFHALEGKK